MQKDHTEQRHQLFLAVQKAKMLEKDLSWNMVLKLVHKGPLWNVLQLLLNHSLGSKLGFLRLCHHPGSGPKEFPSEMIMTVRSLDFVLNEMLYLPANIWNADVLYKNSHMWQSTENSCDIGLSADHRGIPDMMLSEMTIWNYGAPLNWKLQVRAVFSQWVWDSIFNDS